MQDCDTGIRRVASVVYSANKLIIVMHHACVLRSP